MLMAVGPLSCVLDYLRRDAVPRAGGLTDGQMLGRYIACRDEAAFAALVRRHGPMVLGVCRRVLANLHDAEDAFQATFLVLVRRAGSVAPRERVGNWLYGVAYRTALEARAAAARRRTKERRLRERARPEASPDESWSDLRPLLDRELSRLPEKYRAPVILCDLEGKARREAARILGWPEGTLSCRLARARALLAGRLKRHGLALSAGTLGIVLTGQATARLSAPLAARTAGAAVRWAEGKATSGVISARVAGLTHEVLRTMLLTKLKVVTVVLLAVFGIGVGAWSCTIAAAEPTPVESSSVSSRPAVVGGAKKPAPETTADRLSSQGKRDSARGENERLERENKKLKRQVEDLQRELRRLKAATAGGEARGKVNKSARFTQIRFEGPAGATVAWEEPAEIRGGKAGKRHHLVLPGRANFAPGRIYRLKVSGIPGRKGLELYPTLEVCPARAQSFLAHCFVAVKLTDEDLDQASAGNLVTKVIYLPSTLVAGDAPGPEEVVSARLEPGVDPVAEARRRGEILVVVRLGGIDLGKQANESN
jgi:RNA polymerase sigma factor (sigma-70 family)